MSINAQDLIEILKQHPPDSQVFLKARDQDGACYGTSGIDVQGDGGKLYLGPLGDNWDPEEEEEEDDDLDDEDDDLDDEDDSDFDEDSDIEDEDEDEDEEG